MRIVQTFVGVTLFVALGLGCSAEAQDPESVDLGESSDNLIGFCA